MAYVKEDKSKGVIESYTPDWIEKIETKAFTPKLIPGINDNKINQAISVET